MALTDFVRPSAPRPSTPSGPSRPSAPPRPTMPRPATPRPFVGHLPIGATLTPVRQVLSFPSPPRDAGFDGPVEPPAGTGEELPPSSAVADATATRKSTEVLVALGAGASHRHEPDRPTAPGLPPRPIDYPRPQPRQVMPGTAELAAAINASLARRSR